MQLAAAEFKFVTIVEVITMLFKMLKRSLKRHSYYTCARCEQIEIINMLRIL